LWLALWPVGWACDDLSPDAPGLAPSRQALLAALAKPKDPPAHLQHKVERRTTPVCERPFGLAVAPDEQTLFVACAGSGQIAALDTDHLELRWITSPLYDRLYKLVVDPRRPRLYAVGMNGRLVHAIDRRDGTLLDQ
jgi:sugar lactone lactonase YvrE